MTRTENLSFRCSIFVVGLFFMAFGIALSIKADLGTTPISSLPYVLSLGLPLSMGVITVLMHVCFVVMQIALLRRNYQPIQLLQLLVALIFGVFTDVTIYLVDASQPATSHTARWSLCLAGILLVAFGVFLEVRARLIYLAGEGVCLAISRVFRLEFGKVKVGFDCSLVALAVLSAWGLFGKVQGVREGTVISAILVGILVRLFAQRLAFLDRWLSVEESPQASPVHQACQSTPGTIVIVREFGSGGHEIGENLARQLGVPFYDSAMIEMSAAQSGLSETFVREHEQKLAHRLLFELYEQNYAYVNDEMPPLDLLFMTQSKVVREMSEKGSCVIVGRCADFVLKYQPDCLTVFIHADKTFRIRRIVTEYGAAKEDAPKLLADTDRQRAGYYRHYTHQLWGMATNYDLTIDSARFGINGSVSLILDALHLRIDTA